MYNTAIFRNRRGSRRSPSSRALQCSVGSVPFRSHFLPDYLSSSVSSCRLLSVYHVEFKCRIENLNEDSIALNWSLFALAGGGRPRVAQGKR